MALPHLTSEIERQSAKDIQIADELAEILVFCCQRGYVKSNDRGIKTKTIVNACTEASYQRLERLVSLGFLNKYKQGADTWIIHEPTGDFLDYNQMATRVSQEIREVIRHAQQDSRVKRIVGSSLNVSPSTAITELKKGGPWDQRQKLEKVVDAIDDDPRVNRGNYGKIIIRNAPNYYQATRSTENLYKK